MEGNAGRFDNGATHSLSDHLARSHQKLFVLLVANLALSLLMVSYLALQMVVGRWGLHHTQLLLS